MIVVNDSSFSIVTVLRAGRSGIRFQVGVRHFISAQRFGLAVAAQQTCSSVDTGVNRLGLEVDHSSQPNAEDTNEWSYTPTPPMP
jgi:hypothetical protein